ncbi:MAG TPA: acylphosphatase [Phycisphaerae bacterium]|jgi:acylphosphatase
MAERRTIIFSGRVQGVGFRYTTVQLAQDLPLSGTVQNLPDGSVQLIAQGEPAAIEKLLDRLREHFEGHIRNVTQDRSPSPLPLRTGISAAAKGVQIIH